MPLTIRVFIALAVGLLAGRVISASGNSSLLSLASFVEQVGVLWVNAIRMTVIPLVVSLIIVSIVAADIGAVARMGGRTLMLFLALLSATAVFAVLAAPILLAWISTNVTAASSLALGTSGLAEAKQLPTFGEWLVGLVPANPFKAAADGAMLPLVVFSLLFALAATCISNEAKRALVGFFRAVSETMLVLVRWIIWLAPLGVFALVLGLVARTGASAAGAFGYYVVVICLLVLFLTLLLYPAATLAGRVPLRRFAKAVFPAQAVAISSRSSLASLPPLIDGAKDILLLSPAITGFVLPLAVSTFKISAPLAFVTAAVFLSRLYGVPLSLAQISTLATLAIFMSFSIPGIPSGGLLIMTPFYVDLGLPPEGVGILIALDMFPDMFKTASNVTGNMTVATIVARLSNAPVLPVPPPVSGAPRAELDPSPLSSSLANESSLKD